MLLVSLLGGFDFMKLRHVGMIWFVCSVRVYIGYELTPLTMGVIRGLALHVIRNSGFFMPGLRDSTE